jgi:hemolysin activation/secretion protein
MNSGAVLPDQTVADGVITYQIIEGKLTHIDVQGNKWFGEAFISDRIALGAKTPLNLSPLQDRLQLLQQDQRIERIQAELQPGAGLGESELKVTIEEKPPMSVWLAFNNYQSPSIGAERGLITFAHQNLTGHADTVSLTYGRSEGLTAMIDAWYTIPFTVYDTSLLIRYRQNDYKVVEDVFESLDIENKSEAYELSLRQPVYRTLNQELALVLGLEHERERTFMFGEPFSFYPGAEDGQSVIIPLRFSQEWTYRTQRQVFALRSRFSAGIGMGDATIHGDQPDGRYLIFSMHNCFSASMARLRTTACFPWNKFQSVGGTAFGDTARTSWKEMKALLLRWRHAFRSYKTNCWRITSRCVLSMIMAGGTISACRPLIPRKYPVLASAYDGPLH